MTKFTSFVFSLLFFLTTNSAYSADEISPFQVRNQNPLIAIYDLPAPTSAKLLNKSEFQSEWLLDISNTLNLESSPNERLLIDGENQRFNVSFKYGLTDNINIKINIPFIKHSSGFLDGIIDDYHELLSFNPGNRPSQIRNRLLYTYDNNGNQGLFIDSGESGLGDILIQLAYQLAEKENFSMSLWGGLAVPTGDATKLTGSDSNDVSVWAATSYSLHPSWQLFSNFGFLLIDRTELNGLQNENLVTFADIGLQWKLSSRLFLKAQVDAHSKFFKNTELRFLGNATQMSFGASLLVTANTVLDIAISEDIKVNASPDVNFHFALRFLH